jgi:hypothetical protein
LIRKKGDKQSSVWTILDGKKVKIWDPVALDTPGNIYMSAFTSHGYYGY